MSQDAGALSTAVVTPRLRVRSIRRTDGPRGATPPAPQQVPIYALQAAAGILAAGVLGVLLVWLVRRLL